MNEQEQNGVPLLLADRARLESLYVRDGYGTVVSPGKFQGEPLWVAHLWEIGLEGLADSESDGVFCFFIGRGDPLLQAYPELGKWLGRKRSVRLREDSQGFVHAY